jgi:hypothetical protein
MTNNTIPKSFNFHLVDDAKLIPSGATIIECKYPLLDEKIYTSYLEVIQTLLDAFVAEAHLKNSDRFAEFENDINTAQLFEEKGIKKIAEQEKITLAELHEKYFSIQLLIYLAITGHDYMDKLINHLELFNQMRLDKPVDYNDFLDKVEQLGKMFKASIISPVILPTYASGFSNYVFIVSEFMKDKFEKDIRSLSFFEYVKELSKYFDLTNKIVKKHGVISYDMTLPMDLELICKSYVMSGDGVSNDVYIVADRLRHNGLIEAIKLINVTSKN